MTYYEENNDIEYNNTNDYEGIDEENISQENSQNVTNVETSGEVGSVNIDVSDLQILLESIEQQLSEVLAFQQESLLVEDIEYELSETDEALLQMNEILTLWHERQEEQILFDEENPETLPDSTIDDLVMLLISTNEQLEMQLEIAEAHQDSLGVIEEANLLSATYLLAYVPFVFFVYLFYKIFSNFVSNYR